ncbi:MAG: hypothetical protein ACE5OS_08855 [Anaerolineae bacterium]
MPLFLALTFILPLLGAVGILGLSLVPRLRPYIHYVALAAVGFTTILVLTFRWSDPVMGVPSLWKPVSLFGATLTLQSDVMVQPLAFALALATCGAALVALGRTVELSSRLAASLLALLSAGFVSLWAANPLTMIVSWAIYDLLQAAGYIAAGGSVRTAVRGLVFGSAATLLLWAGTVLSYGGASGRLWSLVVPGRVQLTLWAVAGVLRLWVYPFHLATPDDLDSVPSLAVLLLLEPTTGWGLWLRLASANGGAIPGDAWVPGLAAVTLAVGGFLAWSCKRPRSMLPWIGMGVTGAVLLAAVMAGESATTVMCAGSVTWVLGVSVLFLSDGLRKEAVWWSFPTLVGALALVGAPLTLGFVAESTLLGGLAQGGRLEWGGAFFIGDLFLIPALARWLLLTPPPTPPRSGEGSLPFPRGGGRGKAIAHGVGLGLPALPLLIAGFYPPLLIGVARPLSLGTSFTMSGLLGWLLWVVSLAGGGVLVWQERNLRSKIGLWLSATHDLLRLGWLYDVVLRALGRGLSVLRAADEVVGGAGALLWSWLLFLILLLAWGSK